MSPHFIFLIYILAAVSGIIALVYFTGLYLQKKTSLVAKYLKFLASYSFMILASTVAVYLSVNLAANAWPLHVFVCSVMLSSCALTYTLPNFIFSSMDYSPPQLFNDFFRLTLAGCPFLITAYIFLRNTPQAPALVILSMLLFGFAFLYSLWVIWKNRQRINKSTSPVLRFWLNVYISFAIFAVLSENLFLSDSSFNQGYVLSMPLIYFFWNIISFFLGLEGSTQMIIPAGINQAFIDAYQLTQREQVVAEHVLKGSANKEIAQVLNISPHTVKNHIYNLFQKLKVQSRIGLIRKFQQKL